MKNIYIISALFLCLIAFWACDDDNKVNYKEPTPTTFVLNTPSYASGIYDLKNTESVELTTTQPDYGFTAATIYKVQVSLDGTFEEAIEETETTEAIPATYRTLNSPYTTAKMNVVSSELAVAIVNLMGIENEEDYPKDPKPVHIRLVASLTNGMGEIFSNVIILPNVKGYFALEPMVLPENMFIIGSINDWEWGKAFKMVPVNDNAGKFWRLAYMDAGATIKFNSVESWDGNEFGYGEDRFSDSSVSYAGIEDDGGNIKINNAGWYLIVVSTTIEGRSYLYQIDFLEPNVYLTGEPSGGWDVFDEPRLFTVPNGDGEFVSPAFIANGELRMCVKLDGIDWWRSEFLILNGEIEYRGNGGDQERVSVNEGQKAYLNFTNGTGRVE